MFEETLSFQPLSEPQATEILAGVGIFPTAQRVCIAQVLFTRRQHLSADQIREQACHQGLSVSKATVYNTLRLFAQNGLLREVFVDPSKVFYDTNTEPHHHFYDLDTGLLTDLAYDQVNLGNLPKPPNGTRIDTVEVIVRTTKR